MITDKDAEDLVAEMRALSKRHDITTYPATIDEAYNDAYIQGQHDGRKGAFTLAAFRIEQNNHENIRRSPVRFLLEQASDHTREEIIELTTLEQLLELVGAEGRHKTWFVGVIVEELTLKPNPRHPDIEWGITIYDDWLEL